MPEARRLHALAVSSLLMAALAVASCGRQQENSSTAVAEEPATQGEVRPPKVPDVAPPASQQEQELLALEQDYSQALIRRDRAFLEGYYAADWRGGNWLGFWTKATMLKAVLEDRYEIRSMTLQNVQVRVAGNIGIVQGVSNEVTRVDGRDTSGRWTFTDVFEWRDDRWVAIASHTSELTGQPPNE